MPPEANAEQIEYWNEQAGARWAEGQEDLDRWIEPLGLEAMGHAKVQPGESVIDIGCGCGQTSLELARRVGASGSVLGIDISEPMLARARERAESTPNLAFLRADAQTHAFEPASADLLFSRFGVMFFEDPGAAFANLRRSLRPGGRLTFLCWQGMEHNPWMREPLRAAAQLVELPPPPPPGAPGPMAFADSERVEGLLRDAGFRETSAQPFDTEVSIAGGGGLEQATDFMLQFGPVARIVAQAGGDLAPVRDAVRDVLAPHQTSDGIRMGAGMWIYQATNPG
jgi:SAM-dependent methyltransferase